MHTCPHTDDVITFGLGQLPPDEARNFQRHLVACPACRLQLAEVDATLELLALATPPVDPPPNLKARVVGNVAEAAAADRRKRRTWTLPAWGAAAAAVAIVLGSYAVLRIDGLQERINGIQQAAPVERSIAMVGTAAAPAASGRVLVAREGGGARIALQTQGLPALEPGQAYQLWLIKDGKRTSGGVFVVDATGKGGLATWLPEPAEFDALGITREPDAFSLQPRGQKVMGSST
ncbi:MAG TPA: anti-sigma factor [Symbiobacteriaceae bacterium]|jgi:anti-sigma-K factor RskA